MTTIADLYQQLLGRAPDEGGLAYWTQQFGNSIDPTEIATFQSVAAPELAARGAVAPTAAPAPSTTGDAPMATQVDKVGSFAPVAPQTVNDLYQTFYGTPGNAEGLAYWGGADKAVNSKDAASWLHWAAKDPSIADKSTGITVDQAYQTYLGFKPDDAARNYWTGGDPNKELTTAELAAITSEHYKLNPDTGFHWNDLRDTAEAAAVIAGNYFLPGSSLLTSQLVSQGAKDQLNTDAGKIANLASGVTGGVQGNLSNYGTIGEAAGLTGPTAGAGTGGEALSGIDLGGVGGSPNTWLGNGVYGAVPAAVGGTTAAQLAAAGSAGTGAGAGAGAGAAAAGGTKLSDAMLLSTGANVVGGLVGANAAKDAAATQAAAANTATQQQMDMFNKINAQQAPYRAAGYGALGNLGSLGTGSYQKYDANGNPIGTGIGSGYLQHQFDKNDLAAGLAPNYDFMLQQGQMANQRAANMSGGGLGGNALQGLNKFTQDYAGNAYQNAFNNYQTQRNNIYNTLAGIAGIGQTGQTATNTAATNATNAATQLGVGSAAAQAAGTVGSANAITNAANNAINNYTLASLLSQSGRVA